MQPVRPQPHVFGDHRRVARVGFGAGQHLAVATDAPPRQTEFNNAGVDVSPALNGCLGFTELDSEKDRVSWQFIDDVEVPAARGAPWSPPRP